MTTITGTIGSIVKGKPFNIAGRGDLVTHTITVNTDTGSVKVQKSTLTTTDFTIPEGTKVQVTYETTSVNSKTGNVFVNNKIVKDGLLILQGDTPVQITSQGAPKPEFNARPLNEILGPVKTGGSSYSSEGARNGMIVNASLALATARAVQGITASTGQPLSLTELKQAADDIKALTGYVETGLASTASEATTPAPKASAKPALKALPKKQPVLEEQELDLDDDSPFDLD